MENLVDSPVIQSILETYAEEAVRVFKRETQRAGLVSSGDMLNSIRESALLKGQDFISARVEYNEVFRLKDIKLLRYTTVPPVEPIREWVERNLSKFPRVPGYKDSSKISTEKKIERISAAVVFKMQREPNVKRGYRGIYNEPFTKEVLPRFFRDLRENAGAHAMTTFRAIFND